MGPPNGNWLYKNMFKVKGQIGFQTDSGMGLGNKGGYGFRVYRGKSIYRGHKIAQAYKKEGIIREMKIIPFINLHAILTFCDDSH
jgi:hypothetical protein